MQEAFSPPRMEVVKISDLRWVDSFKQTLLFRTRLILRRLIAMLMLPIIRINT